MRKLRDRKVLVTGSRKAGGWALEQVERIVHYLIDRETWIIVGDAEDVDDTVIRVANERKYKRISCWGAYGKMRRGVMYGMNIPYQGDYLQRDDQMAFYCTHCVAVWNGWSRGTKYTFESAGKLGKPTLVYEIPWEVQIKQTKSKK